MNASAMMAQARPPAQPADDAPHVLLVDDDRRIRDLLSRFLSSEGYRVTTAASASDARAKLLGRLSGVALMGGGVWLSLARRPS